MRRSLAVAASTVLALILALPALAQQSAMFILRSGEQVSGELVDMGGSGFQVRVGGAARQLSTGDVAVIDFSGSTSFPDNEVNQIQAGKHLIVLSNGQIVSGNLYDIGGEQPKRISVHTDTGNRDFRSNEVRRIYLARPSGARAATPVHAGRAGLFDPPGNRRTDSCACQPALDRHGNHGAPRRQGDVQCQRPGAVQRERQRQGDLGRGEQRTAPIWTDGQRARGRAARTCGPGGGLCDRQPDHAADAGGRTAVPRRERRSDHRQPGRVHGRRAARSDVCHQAPLVFDRRAPGIPGARPLIRRRLGAEYNPQFIWRIGKTP